MHDTVWSSTHTLFAPLVEGERETLQRKLNASLGLHVNPNTLKSVITPSMLDGLDPNLNRGPDSRR
jgi:hypothetical protein